MERRTLTARAAVPAALLLAFAACEAKKSSNPLSPTVAGPIPGVEITAPKLLEPAQGFRFKENQQPIKLLIENSSTNGVRPISYAFEVATDSAFTTKVFARNGVAPGDGGRTSVQIDALELGRAYYWRARAEDGANSSTYAAAAFEVLPRALLTVPTAVAPVGNAQVTSRRPTLAVRNSQHNAAVGTVIYYFMVAKDQAFTQISATGATSEDASISVWTIDRDLDYGLTHYWRSRASDGETTSDWTPTQAFRTPGAPAPTPSPSPGPAPGGPCNASTPLPIVECERAKYGHMSTGQMLEFVKATVRSLNRNGISGAPFGILRKEGGHNCGGYSCDVICSGNGGGQRQWDILGDIEGAQDPRWAGPNTGSSIRVDLCFVQ